MRPVSILAQILLPHTPGAQVECQLSQTKYFLAFWRVSHKWSLSGYPDQSINPCCYRLHASWHSLWWCLLPPPEAQQTLWLLPLKLQDPPVLSTLISCGSLRQDGGTWWGDTCLLSWCYTLIDSRVGLLSSQNQLVPKFAVKCILLF